MEKENKRLQRPVIKLFDIMSIYVEFKWNTRLLAQVEIVFLFYFYWQKWKLCEFVVQLERSYLCSMTSFPHRFKTPTPCWKEDVRLYKAGFHVLIVVIMTDSSLHQFHTGCSFSFSSQLNIFQLLQFQCSKACLQIFCIILICKYKIPLTQSITANQHKTSRIASLPDAQSSKLSSTQLGQTWPGSQQTYHVKNLWFGPLI